MTDVRPILKQGSKAIFRSAFCGNVKCVVLSIEGADGAPNAAQRVTLRTTEWANRYYARNTIFETSANDCIPRAAFHQRRLGALITYYTVECNVKREAPLFTLSRFA